MSDQSLSDIWRTCLPWSNSRATWEWRVKAMGDRQTETLRDKWLQQPMQNLQHTKNMFMMLSFSSDHQFWDVLSFVGTFRDFLRFLVFFSEVCSLDNLLSPSPFLNVLRCAEIAWYFSFAKVILYMFDVFNVSFLHAFWLWHFCDAFIEICYTQWLCAYCFRRFRG